MSATSHGTCLCGSISWKFSSEPETAVHCHCSMCRKAHGAAFASYYCISEDDFEWTSSLSTARGHFSSPTACRKFCGTCGSVIPYPGFGGTMMFLPAGSHDQGPAITAHIFTDSKAPWHEIRDDLPQYSDYPKDMPGPVLPDRILPPKPKDVVARGSCLCRAVTFEVTEPFRIIHNCHCSRCRRARATAFATNGFTSAQGVRFLSGTDHVRQYKLPRARYFTQVFCDLCGSGLPRVDTERGLAVIPLGALDDDTGQRPVDHIFVDDRADWYEIGDDLPRFPGEPESPST